MKNKIAILCLLTATVAMAIMPYSLRMRGMGPGLVGIVDDEYSDLYFNPALINNVEGTRVYTNLSNIHNTGSDQIFADWYEFPQYNLIGGITSYNDMKIGGLLETGGTDYIYTDQDYETEIDGNERWVDSTNIKMTYKDLRTTVGLIWGKTFGDMKFGILTGPQIIDQHYEIINKTASYYYRNDTMFEYTYEEADSSTKANAMFIPVKAGICMGTPENELSASFAIAYDETYSLFPTKVHNSILLNSISQTPWTRDISFANMDEKYDQGGLFVTLSARNKKRFEDYSYSFLGGIEYYNQPGTITLSDSTYEYEFDSGPSDTDISEFSQIAKIDGKSTDQGITVGIGVGAEKYFDVLNTKSIFAIGFIPAYKTGKFKVNINPGTISEYHYDSYYYGDTLEYTYYTESGEYVEQNINYSGIALSIPVGLETYLTPRLSFRLGASQDMMLMFKENFEETMTDSGWTETWTYAHPNDTVITDYEPDGELDSYYTNSEAKTNFANSTTYYYGFGYKINDNVELNFLNNAALTDLSEWILGVNIKF